MGKSEQKEPEAIKLSHSKRKSYFGVWNFGAL